MWTMDRRFPQIPKMLVRYLTRTSFVDSSPNLCNPQKRAPPHDPKLYQASEEHASRWFRNTVTCSSAISACEKAPAFPLGLHTGKVSVLRVVGCPLI